MTGPSRAIWAAIGATVAVVALLFLLVGYFVLRARRRRQRQWHERNDPRLQPTPNLTHQVIPVINSWPL
jgi:predicted LPLAT superfamily acyltransferase